MSFFEYGEKLTDTEDQTYLNFMLIVRYYLGGHNINITVDERNEYIRSQQSKGECLEMSYKAEPDNARAKFSMWLLNPILFPLRPTYELSQLHKAIAEPPYLVHYNWLLGRGSKEHCIKQNCQWWTDEVRRERAGVVQRYLEQREKEKETERQQQQQQQRIEQAVAGARGIEQGQQLGQGQGQTPGRKPFLQVRVPGQVPRP